MRLSEYHAKFPGGIRWRIALEGVELEGKGLLKYNTQMYETAAAFVGQYGEAFASVSKEYGVPMELLIACASTQSPGGPVKFVWRDPGYVGDDITPSRISAGVCRMLLSTAQFFLKDPTLDHYWLLDVHNSVRACAAYMRFNRATLRTGWDPVLVACAFNAGGLYEDQRPGNYWRLRQYSMLLGFHSSKNARVADSSYAGRFSGYFSAARQLVDAGLLNGREFAGFRPLIANPLTGRQ
jgi:hypothetical protein